MAKAFTNRYSVLLGACVLLLPCAAFATNGYFSAGYSATQKGMAGAGTALGGDAFVGSINPALLTDVGTRTDFNLSLFVPIRSYTAENGPNLTPLTGAGLLQVNPAPRERSLLNFFPIPGLAFSWRIDDDSVWGITLYGNGGLDTNYNNGTATFANGDATGLLGFSETCNGAFGGGRNIGPTGAFGLCGNRDPDPSVDIIQLFVVPTYARKWGRVSLGIAPIFAVQRFKATGLSAFARFSESPTRVSDNGADLSVGGGARVGINVEVFPWLRVGGSYQSRVYMTKFDKYAGLFNDQGQFDIPSNYNLGIALIPFARHRFVFDFQRINFNEVSSVGDKLDPNEFVNDCARPRLGFGTERTAACLGGNDGPGFGWRDVPVFKFGYEYVGKKFDFRMGYSKSKQPIRSSEVLFNILAPATPEEHFTAGMTWHYSKNLGFDFAAVYVPGNTVRGKNPLSNVQGGATSLLLGGNNFGVDPNDQDIALRLKQFELTFGVNFL